MGRKFNILNNTDFTARKGTIFTVIWVNNERHCYALYNFAVANVLAVIILII